MSPHHTETTHQAADLIETQAAELERLRAVVARVDEIVSEPAPGWLDLHSWRSRLRAALDGDAEADTPGT